MDCLHKSMMLAALHALAATIAGSAIADAQAQ